MFKDLPSTSTHVWQGTSAEWADVMKVVGKVHINCRVPFTLLINKSLTRSFPTSALNLSRLGRPLPLRSLMFAK